MFFEWMFQHNLWYPFNFWRHVRSHTGGISNCVSYRFDFNFNFNTYWTRMEILPTCNERMNEALWTKSPEAAASISIGSKVPWRSLWYFVSCFVFLRCFAPRGRILFLGAMTKLREVLFDRSGMCHMNNSFSFQPAPVRQ